MDHSAFPRLGAPTVCIVTPEVLGATHNGGIGTTYTALAQSLADAGIDVTLLYLGGDHCVRGDIESLIDKFRQEGIALVPLPPADLEMGGGDALVQSFRAYQWLRERSFDVVHFPEWTGPGYHSIVAKRQGDAFHRTIFCVGVHSPTAWIAAGNGAAITRIDDLERDAMERACVEGADVVWFPSQSLQRWTREAGWTPREEFLRGHAPSRVVRDRLMAEPSTNSVAPVRELVFFGRLETRKGLRLFLDAIDRLAANGSRRPGLDVTFLGRSLPIEGMDATDFIRQRSGHWPYSVNCLTSLDQAQALDYLSQPGRLAVIPSLVDNLALTAIECVSLGIPMIATNVGGVPEVVAKADRDRVLVAPDARDLADRLEAALREGMPPARAAADPLVAEREWIAWHHAAAEKARTQASPGNSEEKPLVSVCLTHHDRPRFLEQAVTSLTAQDYPRFEVILVDDGSPSAGATALLDRLESEFAERNWRLVRQENRYLGAARNRGAKEARGEFLLFMDDDNLAKPDELSRLVRTALATGATIVTSSLEIFTGQGAPDDPSAVRSRWLFPPADRRIGVFRNCFGDANALVRRADFEELGGFTEDQGVTHEDWELFARCHLAGKRIEVLPEPAFFYRYSPGSMVRRTNEDANFARSLRPFLTETPPEWRDVIRLAQGQSRRIAALEEENRELRDRARWLRYRLADQFNAGLHRIPFAQPLAKRMIGGGVRTVRLALSGGRRLVAEARRALASIL